MRIVDLRTIPRANASRGRLPVNIRPEILAGVLAAFIFIVTVFVGPRYWTHALAGLTASRVAAFFVCAAALRWRLRDQAVAALLCVYACYFAFGVGIAASLTVGLFLISARELGAMTLDWVDRSGNVNSDFSKPVVVGVVLLLAVLSSLEYTKVNTFGLQFAILAAPALVAFARGRFGSARAIETIVAEAASLPYWRLTATLVIVGFAAQFAFLPSTGYDDLALHLARWTQFETQHRLSRDVADNIWAVAPNSLELLHATLSSVARSDARAAIELALFGLTLGQIFRLVERFGLVDKDRLLLIALAASTPMSAFIVMTLQTEGLVGFLVVFAVRVTVGNSVLRSSDVIAVLAAAGLSAATKLNAIPVAACFAGAAFIKFWLFSNGNAFTEIANRWKSWLLLTGVIGYVALKAYVDAWVYTGNPIFPLFNGVFCAAHYACENFSDIRWSQGASPLSYARMFFHTSSYGEVQNFVAGFQFLFLIPFAFVLLFRRLSVVDALVIAVPVLTFGALMFSQIQYLRYLYPVMPLAGAAIGAVLPRNIVRADRYGSIARIAAMLCLVLNLWFVPGIAWQLQEVAPTLMDDSEQSNALARLAPVAALTEGLNSLGSHLRVLYAGHEPFGALLHGEPLYVNWYAYDRMRRFEALRSDDDISAFLASERADYVIVSQLPVLKSEQRIADYLSRFGRPERSVGGDIAFRVGQTQPLYRAVWRSDAPKIAKPAPSEVATFDTGGARTGRYRFAYRCHSETGYFIAQINWDAGSPLYQLAPCSQQVSERVISFVIPAGAVHGTVFMTARDTDTVDVGDLSVETN